MNELSIFSQNNTEIMMACKSDDIVAMYNAISDSKPISEAINRSLKLLNIILTPSSVTDRNTGEIKECVRTTLITEEGAFGSPSQGIYSSIKKLCGMTGTPDTWPDNWRIQIVQVPTTKGMTYNIKLLNN